MWTALALLVDARLTFWSHCSDCHVYVVLPTTRRRLTRIKCIYKLRGVTNAIVKGYRGLRRDSSAVSPVVLVNVSCSVSIANYRHRASTSMYSLTFCVRVMSPERHHWKPAVQAAAVMLRTPPSTASHRPAARADPAERSHYVVISRDGRKLV